ncbi:hypothetical protein AX768_02230 [Burkholderia sp. PAMC 28687]|uniref:hypothetical protein n=1 Tax=Burkholderia sp. PAMC 28687 TaxID=1795874 RepID=UPI000781F21D|nr:hypothetical protein [Burkholderia sp. PAMC 28687]AMM13106.1 hypothetical protein AX768_02230 [Burkholderia sp. PAMC 28687]
MKSSKQGEDSDRKLPASFWEFCLQWVSARYGYRAAVVCLALIAAPPASWLLFTKVKDLELHRALAATQWANQHLSTAGSVTLNFIGSSSPERTDKLVGTVSWRSKLLDGSACRLVVSIETTARLVGINDKSPADNIPLRHRENIFELALTDVTIVSVKPKNDELIFIPQTLSFFSLDSAGPYSVSIGTGDVALISRAGKEDVIAQKAAQATVNGPLAMSVETFSWNESDFEIPLATQTLAESFRQRLETSISACKSIKRFSLCDDKSGC